MAYTLRRTWPEDSDRSDDYVFRADGIDAGRCYLRTMAGNQKLWQWTVYGTNASGNEASLEDAKARFRERFEALKAAGGLPKTSLPPT